MITLDAAKEKVLKAHKGMRVHVINEYENFWAFGLVPENTKVVSGFAICDIPVVYKVDGRFEDNIPIFDDRFDQDYKPVNE